MRIPAVMLALALAVPASAAAQSQTPGPALRVRHTFLPQHKTRLSVDFGARKAAQKLSQLPIRCETVQKHRHGLLPVAGSFVELPLLGAGVHRLVTAPAAPCPVK